MTKTSRLTQERLKEVLDYNPETGAFTRLVMSSNSVTIGERAGHIRKDNGRCYILVDGKRYRSSKLAVLYMTGEMPAELIDHRDTNPSNDAWTNLRFATKAQNGYNRGPQCNNPWGLKGVYQRASGRFGAKIKADGSVTCLGTHDTREEAAAAYDQAAIHIHGEFARINGA